MFQRFRSDFRRGRLGHQLRVCAFGKRLGPWERVVSFLAWHEDLHSVAVDDCGRCSYGHRRLCKDIGVIASEFPIHVSVARGLWRQR